MAFNTPQLYHYVCYFLRELEAPNLGKSSQLSDKRFHAG